jgi:hypothetical protein
MRGHSLWPAINRQFLRAPAIRLAATRSLEELYFPRVEILAVRKNAGYATDAASLFIKTKLGFGLKQIPERIDAFEKSDFEKAANLP